MEVLLIHSAHIFETPICAELGQMLLGCSHEQNRYTPSLMKLTFYPEETNKYKLEGGKLNEED